MVMYIFRPFRAGNFIARLSRLLLITVSVLLLDYLYIPILYKSAEMLYAVLGTLIPLFSCHVVMLEWHTLENLQGDTYIICIKMLCADRGKGDTEVFTFPRKCVCKW